MKSDRGSHRDAFLRDAPDLVIVDEAHNAARPPGAGGRTEQQRYELLRALANDPSRHFILVTATPHSGIEESFRSLLGLLDPDLENERDRKRLLPHVIQRRRHDVEQWLGDKTPFPERLSEEERYDLGPDYMKLFDDVLDYCRETVEAGTNLKASQQRVRRRDLGACGERPAAGLGRELAHPAKNRLSAAARAVASMVGSVPVLLGGGQWQLQGRNLDSGGDCGAQMATLAPLGFCIS